MSEPEKLPIEIAYGAVILNDGEPRVASLLREKDFLAAIRAKMDAGMGFDEAFAELKVQVMRQVRRSLQ